MLRNFPTFFQTKQHFIWFDILFVDTSNVSSVYVLKCVSSPARRPKTYHRYDKVSRAWPKRLLTLGASFHLQSNNVLFLLLM